MKQWRTKLAIVVLIIVGCVLCWLEDPALKNIGKQGTTNLIENFYTITDTINPKIENVEIQGRHLTEKNDIFEALSPPSEKEFRSFSVSRARERLLKLPFVENAVVQRAPFSRSVTVTLSEHSPIAVWQTKKQLLLVDTDGTTLVPQEDSRVDRILQQMPLIVGDDANLAATSFIPLFNAATDLKEKTTALVRIGKRRWDVILKTGQTIKLPETKESAALKRFSFAEKQLKLTERPISVIDLRLPDRIVLRIPDKAEQEKIIKESLSLE
ncbi:FtsQ-type POTRA domain-containing protein [Acetobacteraceae bacterium]|nr:FtsQ-type POTRA domain-containing protein [Acetobacteraceae bacterium]